MEDINKIEDNTPISDTTNTKQNGVSSMETEPIGQPNSIVVPPTTPKIRNRKIKEHITPATTPHFYEPFKKNWTREVVKRTTATLNKKADVYYYSPTGRKLRSMPDIEKYLNEYNVQDITLANFTFYTDSISEEPYEYVRQARTKSDCLSNSSTSTPTSKKKTPKLKNKSKTSHSHSEKKKSHKSPVKKLACKKSVNSICQNTDTATETPESVKNICTFSCKDVANIMPSLMCNFCLVLFHPECVKEIGERDPFLCHGCLQDAQYNHANRHLLLSNKQMLEKLLVENEKFKKMSNKEGGSIDVPQPLSVVRLKKLNRQNGMALLKIQNQQTVYPSDPTTMPLPKLIPLSQKNKTFEH